MKPAQNPTMGNRPPLGSLSALTSSMVASFAEKTWLLAVTSASARARLSVLLSEGALLSARCPDRPIRSSVWA